MEEAPTSTIGETLANEPTDAAGWIAWGKALHEAKRDDEAAAAYQRALELDQTNPSPYVLLGNIHLDAQRLEEAIADYERALAMNPNYAWAWQGKAVAYQRWKRYDEALACFDRVVALWPKSAAAIEKRAALLFDLGRYEEVVAACDRALDLDAERPATHWRMRGVALFRLQRFDEAESSFRRALDLEPGYADAHAALIASLYARKRFDEVVEECDHALAQQADARYWMLRSDACRALQRDDEAVEGLRQAVALGSTEPHLWRDLGALLVKLKRPEEALAAFDHLIEPGDHSVASWIDKGNALHDLRRYDAALAAYEQAIILMPDSAIAWSNKGAALFMLKRLDEALAAYERSLALRPDHFDTLAKKARTLARLRRGEEALGALDAAVARDPTLADGWGERADLLFSLGRYDEALDSAEHALMLAPDDERLRTAHAGMLVRVRRTIPDQQLRLRDGRTLGYIEVGDPAGTPIFYFHGLPGSRLDMQYSGDVCRELGIRLICPDRPGYGLSDFQRRRTLLDWHRDVAQLADALGIAHFAVLGVSGGGPYACACAYALPERVTVAGLASSAGPPRVRGVFFAYPRRLRIGRVIERMIPVPLRWPFIRLGGYVAAAMTRRWPESKAESLRWLHGDVKFFTKDATPPASPTERDAITEPFHQGGKGYAWDGRLLSQRWRVPLERINVPVLLWHGERDPFSPAVVGHYLAQHIPGCRATFYPNEKHYVLSDHEREILSTLAEVIRATAS